MKCLQSALISTLERWEVFFPFPAILSLFKTHTKRQHKVISGNTSFVSGHHSSTAEFQNILRKYKFYVLISSVLTTSPQFPVWARRLENYLSTAGEKIANLLGQKLVYQLSPLIKLSTGYQETYGPSNNKHQH